MLTRREVLQLIGATGAGALAHGCASGADGGRLALPAPGPAFPSSMMRPSRKEFEGTLSVVDGQLPSDIDGHAFIMAAMPYPDGTAILVGDGMIYRLSFDAETARLKTRLMRTDDFLVDQAATDPELAFKSTSFIRTSPAFGARNFDNTALLPIMDGRLLVVSDPGRPWEVDPVSMAPISPIGQLSFWKPFAPVFGDNKFFPLLMGSAHPVFDAEEGKIYTVNFASGIEGTNIEVFTRVVLWDGKSEPSAVNIVDENQRPARLEQSCHQIQATRRYLILSDGALKIEPQQFSDPDYVEAQRPTSVLWIIAKADLVPGGTAVARRIELPMESSHFLVDRDDADGRVTTTICHQNSADPTEWVRMNDRVFRTGKPVDPAAVGMLVSAADLMVMGRYTIDVAAGTVVSSKIIEDERLMGYTLWSQDMRVPRTRMGDALWATMGWNPDLLTERLANVYANQPYRRVPVTDLPTTAQPARLLRVDHDSAKITDGFTLPIGHLPQSPVFVPKRNGAMDEGYLLTFVVQPDHHEPWIWPATDIGHGPLCRLRHPDLKVGFMLHSTWVPEIALQTRPAYAFDRGQEYRSRLDTLGTKARALVKDVLGVSA